ncbi:MAG: hypothetical protein GXP62_16645 [Oligoflexia bacterium]|nr:hypothetical protein [Oligoflexia bacterium]
MTSTQAVPSDVLLQSQNIDREGEPTGYRLFEDGRFERRRSGGPWEPRDSLSPVELTKVRQAIIASGLLAAAGHHRAPSQPDDATHRELWVRSGDALVYLNIDSGCAVPAEQALMTAIVDVLR